MSMLRPLLVFGTRPEAVKMAPVVHQCRARGPKIDPVVCVTGQHAELVDPVIDYFDLHPDPRLDLMRPDQTLSGLTARCVEAVDEVLARVRPDCVVAQGDTTTVMATSLAAFYRHIPFVHVEAGLRTGNLQSPWPEEFNRRIADVTAALHCAPTQRAADALLSEGAPPDSVQVTGNTVVDALLQTIARERQASDRWSKEFPILADRPMILVTGHRRESFGRGFENICRAIGTLADSFGEHQFVYPVHLNPNVKGPVHRLLAGRDNVHLVKPAAYPAFVWLMDRSLLILTDSGGMQEEAPSLGRPVLVMRDTTERPEAVEAGAARLVGTSPERIVSEVTRLLTDTSAYSACQVTRNPFGDGRAAERIVDLMLGHEWHK